MDSERPEKGTGEITRKKEKVAKSSSKRPLTDLELRACQLANFPEQCAIKAVAAFWRRVRVSGPEKELFSGDGIRVMKLKEVEVIHEDAYWSEKPGTVHERIWLATWLYLYFESQGEEEELRFGLGELIQRLADKYLWLSFPIVRQTRHNDN